MKCFLCRWWSFFFSCFQSQLYPLTGEIKGQKNLNNFFKNFFKNDKSERSRWFRLKVEAIYFILLNFLAKLRCPARDLGLWRRGSQLFECRHPRKTRKRSAMGKETSSPLPFTIHHLCESLVRAWRWIRKIDRGLFSLWLCNAAFLLGGGSYF